MATTKPKSPVAAMRTGRRRRVWLWVVPLVLIAALAWYWTPLTGLARTGASVGARVACSCRFVAGRSLGDCRRDFEPGMGLVMLSEDPVAKTVTARFPLVAAQTATYRDGPGCVLESWAD